MRFKEIDHLLYFAYGHNTNTKEMKRRCPDARYIGVAVLKNFKLVMKHFADIESSDGDQTQGVLWSISSKDLKTLDHDEGLHDHYNRIPIKVNMGDQELRAAAYIMDPSYRADAAPKDRYVDLVRQGYEEHDIPLDQLEQGLQ